MELSGGARLGPYEIVAPLGAGGMGEVYRACDTRLGRDVALKILPLEVANDAARRQRFEREARAVAALNHPNIVAVYDVGDGYIVSELVDGEPLRDPKMTMRKALDVAAQIASGMSAAHDAGITHRDLKPDNILLTREGRVKILDFGLAKIHATHATATETATMHTEPGVVMGTVGYMSPEQVRGEDTDHRSDIFNLGLILHELLTGQRVFHGDTKVETMTAILKQEAPELPESVPAPVRQIVTRCLEKQPANRFQSAKDLAFALGLTAPSEAVSRPVEISRPGGRLARAPLLLAAGLFLAAAAAVLATHGLWRERPPALLKGLLLMENAAIPSVSPDGHTVAYSATVGDALELGVINPESGDHAILTHERGKGYIMSSCWSHDGTHIYFDRTTDVPSGVYSIPVLGGEERLLLENAALPQALPDGSLLVGRLAYPGRWQLYRFWPDTGKLRDFPIQSSFNRFMLYRPFPSGRQAIVYGTPMPATAGARPRLYLVDVNSGSVRPFREDLPAGPVQDLAITHDGQSLLTASWAGNLMRVTAIPVSGNGAPVPLLTLTNDITGMGTGPDGSIYLAQTERPAELLRFPSAGGHVERVAALTLSMWDAEGFAVLPDGRAVAPQAIAGRVRLMIYQPGKDPVSLVNTTEQTTAPVAAAGDEVAFVMPANTLATASVANGRITHKIPFEKGEITGLELAPDGATIYCAAGGLVWAVPVAGGEPRKIRPGDSAAIDPSGKLLLVSAPETARPHLFLVPLNGGSEQMVRENANLRPGGPLMGGSLSRDGRAVLAGSSSFWWNPAAIFDTRTGEAFQLALDYIVDFHKLTWTPDGRIMGLGVGLRSKIWRFQPESR